MARINRSDVIQKAVNDLALSVSTEKIPSETLDKVQLVYSLNKINSSFLVSGALATTGTLTVNLPLVGTNQEIYLTGISADFIKDSACDQATGTITISVTPFESNVSTAILRFSTITLTAQNQSAVYSLPYPLKLKSSGATTITFTGTYSLGVMCRSVTATGYVSSSN